MCETGIRNSFTLSGKLFCQLSKDEFALFDELRKQGRKNNLFATVLYELPKNATDCLVPGLSGLERDDMLRRTNSKVWICTYDELTQFILYKLEKFNGKYPYIEEALSVYKNSTDKNLVWELLSKTIDNACDEDIAELGQLEVLLAEVPNSVWFRLNH